MERLIEIDNGVEREQERLEHAYRRLRDEVPASEFAERWRAVAESWDFGELAVLVQQHNDWYPIERQLPIDDALRCGLVLHVGFAQPCLVRRGG